MPPKASTELLSDHLWPTLRGIDRGEQPVTAAFAYFTYDHLNLQEGDVLIVDASAGNVKAGSVDAALLEELFEKGVIIRSRPGLHAKVVSCGTYVVVGSANSSFHSEHQLTEAALICSDIAVRVQVNSFLEQLQNPTASSLLSARDIARLRRIKPNSKKHGSRTKPMNFATTEPDWWWVSIGPLSERIRKREAGDIEHGEKQAAKHVDNPDAATACIRWGAGAPITKRIKVGDFVFRADSDPWGNSENTRVLSPARVLFIQRKDNWVRIHVEELDGYRASVRLAKAQGALKKLSRRTLTAKSARALQPDEVDVLKHLIEL
ncbi:hypothetical protein [Dyella ginsengisoli]|uniref:hypothetical protein n=1 Tax=Dyella ginsengisoli TaxID=363848 RepID=UPI00034B6A97|nr:hypothetical protein [Dyella ginsengisoli]